MYIYFNDVTFTVNENNILKITFVLKVILLKSQKSFLYLNDAIFFLDLNSFISYKYYLCE